MNLQEIKDIVEDRMEEAEGILNGDRDNYDGADGARYIIELCKCCKQLIAEKENIP